MFTYILAYLFLYQSMQSENIIFWYSYEERGLTKQKCLGPTKIIESKYTKKKYIYFLKK